MQSATDSNSDDQDSNDLISEIQKSDDQESDEEVSDDQESDEVLDDQGSDDQIEDNQGSGNLVSDDQGSDNKKSNTECMDNDESVQKLLYSIDQGQEQEEDQFDVLTDCVITEYTDESLCNNLNHVCPCLFEELDGFDKLISCLISIDPKRSLSKNLDSILASNDFFNEKECNDEKLSDIFSSESIFFNPSTYGTKQFKPDFFDIMPKISNPEIPVTKKISNPDIFVNKKVFDNHLLKKSKKYLDESIKKMLQESLIPIDKFTKTMLDKFQSNTSKVQNKNMSNNKKTTNSSISKPFLDLLGTDLTKTIVVMIDYENVGQTEAKKISTIAANLMSNFYRDIKIKVLKFVGYCNTAAIYADIVVRSNRKDAADHYIGYCVGVLESQSNPPLQIHIISKDHFACCLQDFCNNVIHNPSSDDFARMFVNYKNK